ncbi:Phosphatidylinositol 3,5-bisphosphate-binding protein, variant 2 [Purpureocillium takamizusanense]|uniref:Phosphatidylinositol 3,5-bisphosphate-binding protein, variant 2 n=1 Tax=Purpureocillium takamizusanense TaxID=2060973 RepID=A0A9Q8Q6V5_9HYPO|nr:Phosphatidylinositol 3,5-bisphosphate-binding protein, variant 2 [Purpureocillium takamizusanense]UNI13766.1 Phosphatidylinositol 3,5-bisphosphate-binding protein, variant 2 [Purpureocillium takamizusanense]
MQFVLFCACCCSCPPSLTPVRGTVFHTKSCLLKASRDFNAGIGLVEMMGMANYLALVGGGKSPKFAMNKAIIWDDMKGKVALEIAALSSVRGVQLGRERIIVVLQNSVRIYSFAKPPTLLHVYETADNYLGLCCLSEKKIAFPGRTVGQIQLVDLATGNVSIIPAHSSALKAIQLSPDGELLASASETGTLIRVYSTGNCARVAELRRGIDPATIFSLAFSPSGAMLACTSDKSTLHIFDVPNTQRLSVHRSQHMGGDGDTGKWGILGRIPLMPRVFSDVYSFTSAPFEAGDESMIGGIPFSEGTVLGTTRAPKGVIGWIAEDSLVIVGAGQDARWEKFVLVDGEDGKRHCVREGWKRYLGNT